MNLHSQSVLAVNGGTPVINTELERYNPIGVEERNAVMSVMDTGILSQFLGSWEPEVGASFFGGPNVQAFEDACKDYFNVEHCVTVNSWTSGLTACLGAINLSPGDEVIVSPWTMCATATSILHWNAIPVFADIDPHTFTISPESIQNSISGRTKAVLAVDIFGQSCDVAEIRKVCTTHNLYFITDSAQAPGVFHNGKLVGTESDIGGFSLNCHKHINTGEGGIIVTNDCGLAQRARLIRNHGEAVVASHDFGSISNIIGHNYRLGELESAIGIQQLKKLHTNVLSRQRIASKLTAFFSNFEFLEPPYISDGNSHAYYIYGLKIKPGYINIHRDKVVDALIAEGITCLTHGYRNLHLLPLFQQKIAYGSNGFPWSSDICTRNVDYSKGICPIAEKLHDDYFFGFEMCIYNLTDGDLNLVLNAFEKVFTSLDSL